MPNPWPTLVREYREALATYAAGGEEVHLQTAYELGRSGLNAGLGVLDLVRLHQEALVALITTSSPALPTVRLAQAVETFLLEALSPFEAAHRGFRDACERLNALNDALKERNDQLAAANQHYIRLFEEARAMEENLRQLSNRVLTAQEEERKHISRELHDEIGQTLTAVNVSVALLRKHAQSDPEFAAKVENAQRLLEQSMEMVHRFARELRPSMLDHLGPWAALQNYVKSYTDRTGIAVEMEKDADIEGIDVQRGTVLYRVAQECLTNVFKHAQATRVRIRVRHEAATVVMEISDNGRGTASSGEGRQRLGVLGMQERVRLVNGEFAIDSAPRRGTTVRVQIPFGPVSPAPGRNASDFPAQRNSSSNHTTHEQNQCATCR